MPTLEKKAVAKKVVPKKPAEAAKAYAFDFTIGADPEFTVISGTRPINAKNILEAFVKDKTLVSKQGDRQAGFDFKPYGNIGYDGHHATGELRPSPSKKPEEVTANIKALFKEIASRIPFVDFSTLTVAAATGGHIHLAIPANLYREYANQTARWAAIERAVATFTLMISLSENSLSRELRRSGGSYGDLLDFRYDQKFTYPDGTPGFTMEVRGPTAEWITSEALALGTLAYMSIAWDCIINERLKPIESVIFRTKSQAKSSVQPMLKNFAGVQRMYLNKMRPFIRKHPAYPQYKDALELILNPERAVAAKRAAHFSVNEGWGIALKSKDIPTKDFFKHDSIESKTSHIPEAIIRNSSNFSWNNDINVEAFATALGKLSVALGWKPSHEYFLFGLQKGINAVVIMNEAGEFISGSEILQTKEDVQVMRKKFARLSPKAASMYGSFINPKTGELTDGTSEHRVMVGIPYSMRQKVDTSALVKLILKYEKSPKAFRPVDESALPTGPSAVAAQVKQEEDFEAAFSNAVSSADRVREVPREVADEFREEAIANSNSVPVETSLHSMANITSRSASLIRNLFTNFLGRLDIDFRSTPTLFNQALTELMGVPTDAFIIDAFTGLAEMYNIGRPLRYPPQLIKPALLRAVRHPGAPLINGRWSGLREAEIRGTPLRLSLIGLGMTLTNTLHAEVLIDLMGLNSEASETELMELIESSGSVMVIVDDRLNSGSGERRGNSFYFNPDNSLPHVFGD